MRLPLGTDAYKRAFAREPEVQLVNRFFETNPTNLEDGAALLSRPGTTFETSVGTGPMRAHFTLKGLFSSALFMVSGTELYRRTLAGVNSLISGAVAALGSPRMAGVSGAGYNRVFIADGTTLQYYGGNAFDATLTLTPGTITDDVVVVDNVYYRFVAAQVPMPPGTGTATNPYHVSRSTTNALALTNLRAAINATGVDGTDYSTGLVRNTRVICNGNSSTTITVRTRVAGTPLPAVPVSVIVGTSGVLTLTPGVIADDVVQVDGVYYQFVAVMAAGIGTVGNPYKVLVGGSNTQALLNLQAAINASGTSGVTYSAGLVANARMTAINATPLTVTVAQKNLAVAFGAAAALTVTATGGSDGLAWNIASVPGAADGLAWSASTLQIGADVLYGIATPDDVGITDVAVLNSFVLCSVANSQRVYFILPGETEIDPLNFFEAESEPDTLVGLIAVGDQVWLLGQSSTEPWYATGVPETPFRPVAGRAFSRGVLPGTAVRIDSTVFVVGDDNIVYQITGGPSPISTNGISERVRLAVEAQP